MEKRTSKVFKAWMTNEEVRRSVYEKVLAQGTAEDRVTAVNNEFRRLSLTDGITVFDEEGNIVCDLNALRTHVRIVKAYLDGKRYLEERNKYGVACFEVFLTWLSMNRKLDTFEKINSTLTSPDFDAQSLPRVDKEYVKRTLSVRSRIRPELKVGKLARLAFKTYLRNPDRREIERLQDGDYCGKTFHLKRTLPALVRVANILQAPRGDKVGEKGYLHAHYWKDEFLVDGVKYRVVNDWHEPPNPVDNRTPLEDWICKVGIKL